MPQASGVSIGGIGETRLEQLGLTWERNKKINLGIEIGLFEQFKLITELYRYDNEMQLIDLNRLPSTLGLPTIPKANLGRTISEGVDFDFTYSNSWNNFRINYIKGIISYNNNEIKRKRTIRPESSLPERYRPGLRKISQLYCFRPVQRPRRHQQ